MKRRDKTNYYLDIMINMLEDCIGNNYSDDEEYKSVIHDMSNLRLDKNTLKDTGISIRDYIIKDGDLENKDIPSLMRKEYKKRVRK